MIRLRLLVRWYEFAAWLAERGHVRAAQIAVNAASNERGPLRFLWSGFRA